MCCSFTSLGGPRPHAHPAGVRQIVTCDNNVLDRQIVAWAVVHGHRHRPVDNLKYFSRCHIYALLLWEIVGCQFNNNGGEYGINLRLQKHRYQQLERRRSSSSSTILLDTDVSGNAKCNRKELARNFIPDLIFAAYWSRTMDSGPGAKSYNWMVEKVYWIWNQCWRKIQSQMVESQSQVSCGKYRKRNNCGTKSTRIISTSNPGRASAWVFLCIYKYKRIKEQAQAQAYIIYWVGPAHKHLPRCDVMSH